MHGSNTLAYLLKLASFSIVVEQRQKAHRQAIYQRPSLPDVRASKGQLIAEYANRITYTRLAKNYRCNGRVEIGAQTGPKFLMVFHRLVWQVGRPCSRWELDEVPIFARSKSDVLCFPFELFEQLLGYGWVKVNWKRRSPHLVMSPDVVVCTISGNIAYMFFRVSHKQPSLVLGRRF